MKNDRPLVSVIMPAFNAEKFIAESIQSVVNQTYQNWELILINDGSTDSTKEICMKYVDQDKRINYFENDENRGLIFTRNKGLEAASGEFIANLDSDDISKPNRLEVQVAFMLESPKTILLGSSCIEINQDGKPQSKIARNLPNEGLNALLVFSNYFINSSVIFRAKQAKQTLYASDIKLAEDYFFFYRLAKHGAIANLKEPLVYYRVHNSNISKQQQDKLKEDLHLIYSKILKELGLELEPEGFEVFMHAKLVDGPYPKSLLKLKEVEAWLKILVEQNEKVKLFDCKFFNHYCAYFFQRACSKSKLGLKAIVLFKNSELSKWLIKSISSEMSFFS